MKQFIRTGLIFILSLLYSTQVYAQNPADSGWRSTNPNISVIGDFQGQYKTPAARKMDLFLNEVEIALNASVDPYVRADFYLAYARDENTEEFHGTLEEAYLTTLALPGGLQIKAGKFRGTFGKSNLSHPHTLGYIDNPAIIENYFGEALIDEGISINWLVPNTLEFYQEFIFEVTRGPAENNSFSHAENSTFLYLAHLKNFWDVSDNSTLELGFSAANGANDSLRTTQLGGINLAYKWKPLRLNTYRSFSFESELLWSKKEITAKKNCNSFGLYAFSSYQLAKRWFIMGRFDYSNIPDNNKWIERGLSAIVSWHATEFQKLELQLKQVYSNKFSDYKALMLRSVFVIGAHGAHQY